MKNIEDRNGKEVFLKRVREALGRTAPLTITPDHPSLKTGIARQDEKIRTIKAKLESRRNRLLVKFEEMASRNGWIVNRVSTDQEAVQAVKEIAKASEAREIVRSSHDIFRRVDVDSALRQPGVKVTALTSGRGRRLEWLQSVVMGADLGITGVDYGIAETGSCVIIPRAGISRLVSLAPPVHIAVVEPEQILESLDDLLALRRMEYMQGRGKMPAYLNIISGPSRSADIEQTITIGVHGPGEVHLIVMPSRELD